jgi:isocitrate/isopropylmalate dehydrogenase
MQLNVLTVPGDGIGTEVTREGVKVLEKVVAKFGHSLKLSEALLGGIAIHQTGSPFPDDTARKALDADSIDVVDFNEKEKSLTMVIDDTNKDVKRALNVLSDAHVKLQSMSVHQPTLDDVFLSLTGKQTKTGMTAEKGDE